MNRFVENEIIVRGERTQHSIIDTTSSEEAVIRDVIDAAIVDMQAIQAAPLITEAAQITAIKGEAEVLEKLLRFLKRRFL